MKPNEIANLARAMWALVHTLGHGLPNYPVQQECPFCEGLMADEEDRNHE